MESLKNNGFCKNTFLFLITSYHNVKCQYSLENVGASDEMLFIFKIVDYPNLKLCGILQCYDVKGHDLPLNRTHINYQEYIIKVSSCSQNVNQA